MFSHYDDVAFGTGTAAHAESRLGLDIQGAIVYLSNKERVSILAQVDTRS
jgi:hypothetical protein